MDESTRREIEKVALDTLREAGIQEPPVQIEELTGFLGLDRDFYDLENPGFLDVAKHKFRVTGKKLIKTIRRKIGLVAVLLYDENRILIDSELPEMKRDWPTYHEVTHKILPWHRMYFHGDTAQTLDPDWQEQLEYEANYGASELMFCGPVFTEAALDTVPNWSSIKALKDRYKSSFSTTLRRYVQHSHDRPMAMLTSTPSWMRKPEDQPERWRHFVASERFRLYFGRARPEVLLHHVDENARRRRGGPVADFICCLTDDNGVPHEFRVESFFNGYYLQTLFVETEKLTRTLIIGSPTMWSSN